MKLPYEIKVYKRDLQYRAPQELKKIHPLGRSPLVEIIPEGTSKPVVLAETGYIIQYLLDHYNPSGELVPSSPENRELVKYYLNYTEGTLQSLLVSLLVNSKAKSSAPFGFGFLMNKLVGGINQAYYLPELLSNLSFLDAQLAKQSGGYFAGDRLSAADIILSFPLYENTFANPERALQTLGQSINLVEKFPHIHKWSEKIKDEPGYIKAGKILESKL